MTINTLTSMYPPLTINGTSTNSTSYITSSWSTGVSSVEGELTNIKDRLEKIEDRLLILYSNNELQTKYPALQEAYDNYKLIEKLVNDSKK